MHALFVTIDGGGNLPPALGIAGEIVRRGGTARFLGHEPNGEPSNWRVFGSTPFTQDAHTMLRRPAARRPPCAI